MHACIRKMFSMFITRARQQHTEYGQMGNLQPKRLTIYEAHTHKHTHTHSRRKNTNDLINFPQNEKDETK